MNTMTASRSSHQLFRSDRSAEGARNNMGPQGLSAILWRERELLEMLLFKLEEEQLLLTSGSTRWLPFATREVEQVLERLRQTGLERAVAVSSLAVSWGTGDDATLREIIASAPSEAWQDVFTSHLKELTDITGKIAEVRDSNLRYIKNVARTTSETLTNLYPSPSTYDSQGGSTAAPRQSHLFDSDI
jgi:hypothetical protein